VRGSAKGVKRDCFHVQRFRSRKHTHAAKIVRQVVQRDVVVGRQLYP
jgi:hypothetical protein